MIGDAHQHATAQACRSTPCCYTLPLGTQPGDRHPETVRRASCATPCLDVGELAADEPECDVVRDSHSFRCPSNGALDVDAKARQIDRVAIELCGRIDWEFADVLLATPLSVCAPRLATHRTIDHEVGKEPVGAGALQHPRGLHTNRFPQPSHGLLEQHMVRARDVFRPIEGKR